MAWLMRTLHRKGPIRTPRERVYTLAARKAAGIETWPPDALRHTWASCRLALTGDAARTAAEAGHDQSVLHRHYRALTSRAEAEAWFGILPSSDVDTAVRLAV